MHPLVRGAAAAAVLTALGSFYRPAPDPAPSAAPSAVGDVRGIDGLPAPCRPGTLPEGPVCVRIPGENDPPLLEGRDRAPSRGEPVADRIPRRPDRPADPAAYVYPVGEPGHPPRVLAGVNKPGARLAVRPGERVMLLGLEHQSGPAEVIFVGELFGRTVVTAHIVDDGGSAPKPPLRAVDDGGSAPKPPLRAVDDGPHLRTYLLFHGGLDRTAPAVVPGARLEPGAELGSARADHDGSAGLIDIYLEAREVREGAKLDPAPDARRLVDAALGVPTDVRNVLPLRQQP